MNKKLEAIQNLKDKLYQIQNNLENIQKEDSFQKTAPFKLTSPKAAE